MALTEEKAAKSIGLGREKFRQLVEEGHIPYTYHACGSRRIYLTEDIHAYLRGREKFRILVGSPPLNFRKELK
jgi:excisionase family DNA binding protein